MKSRQETKEVTTKQKNLVYGLEGIKTLFGCSTTTAWRIKNTEWIRPAISQVGRKIVVDADLALELANENTQRVTYRKSPPVPPFSKEMKSKNDPLGMSALLSVMPDPIGHPSLTELLDELLRLRIFLVIHPHHLLFRLCDTLSGISPSLLIAESFLFSEALKIL